MAPRAGSRGTHSSYLSQLLLELAEFALRLRARRTLLLQFHSDCGEDGVRGALADVDHRGYSRPATRDPSVDAIESLTALIKSGGQRAEGCARNRRFSSVRRVFSSLSLRFSSLRRRVSSRMRWISPSSMRRAVVGMGAEVCTAWAVTGTTATVGGCVYGIRA